MKIKVCGMREPENLAAVDALGVDYLGFIFYPKSPRFVGDLSTRVREVRAQKVAVFVDESLEKVVEIVEKYDFQAVQLHGKETPQYLESLKKRTDISIFKAFSVDENVDFRAVEAYQDLANIFLFDTKTPNHGGSGVSFDWRVLEKYRAETPFLVAGGISPTDTGGVQNLADFPHFLGIDLNSRFEISAGLKDVALLKNFIESIRNSQIL